MKEEKPDSDYCYETYMFSSRGRESKRCPELDDAGPMKPKCKKYSEVLAWNISGHILKCKDCRKEQN